MSEVETVEKMDLVKFFGTDSGLEKRGARIELSPGTYFTIARATGQKYQTSLRKAYRPYELLLKGGEIPAETDAQLNARVIVESILIGWEGVMVDGTELEFTPQNAHDLLIRLPDLRNWIWQQANDPSHFRVRETQELGKG